MATVSRVGIPSPGCIAVALVAALTAAAPAFPAGPGAIAVGANPEPGAAHPFCSTTLTAGGFGRALTGSVPGSEVALIGGLWVGAEVDRGGGTEWIVSSAAYGFDFWPDGAAEGRLAFQSTYTDTLTDIYPHEPMGLHVTQVAAGLDHPTHGGHVVVWYVVRNISAQWRPPGWDLEHVYLGFFADPDVGRTAMAGHWSDDQAAFVSDAAGDLAYAWDHPGGGDDTATRTGLLLPGRRAHAFRVWSWQHDPTSDAAQYLLLRGASHDTRTIDPPTATPSDYRILLSVGPVTIPRGQAQAFKVAVVCGESLGRGVAAAVDARDPALARGTAGRVVVEPQLVDARTRLVRFAGIPAGATLSIVDVTGRRVASLPVGASGTVAWDLDGMGGRAAGNVYLYRVSGAGEASSGKIVVLR